MLSEQGGQVELCFCSSKMTQHSLMTFFSWLKVVKNKLLSDLQKSVPIDCEYDNIYSCKDSDSLEVPKCAMEVKMLPSDTHNSYGAATIMPHLLGSGSFEFLCHVRNMVTCCFRLSRGLISPLFLLMLK